MSLQSIQKHPHMRGEDCEGEPSEIQSWETPPHAWGRRGFRLAPTFRKGNTPTCVGKTVISPSWMAPQKKHPHMRGEDGSEDAIVGIRSETPPHAWGRLFGYVDEDGYDRNTPTCVGKTVGDSLFYRLPEKHPHMRGEDQDKQGVLWCR